MNKARQRIVSGSACEYVSNCNYMVAVSFVLVANLAFAGVAVGLAQALDQDVSIPEGKSVSIRGTDLVVLFERVLNDSRCPSDAQCVTAGDATVVVAAATGGAAARRYELHTDEGAQDAVHGQFRLTLIGLKPVPSTARPVRADYVLTLRVSRP